jgi:hypothetical protein
MHLKNNWNIYRTRFLVRARQLTQPLVFTDSFGREHCGQPGDYLVETSDGIRRITGRALFEDIYVPLAPEPNTLPAVPVQKRPTPAGLSGVSQHHRSDERHSATA